MDADVKICETSVDIRICFRVNIDTVFVFDFNMDVKWMYPYSFSTGFSLSDFTFVFEKCETFDTIYIHK